MKHPSESIESSSASPQKFCPTRSQQDLFNLLVSDTSLPLYKKIAIAIENHIAQLPPEEQSSARQKLPYFVQFGPILFKYNRQLPDIRLANLGVEYGGITEYDKNIIHDKLPAEYFLKNLELLDDLPPSYDDLLDLLDLRKFEFPLMHKPNKWERWAQMYYLPTLESLQNHWKKISSQEIEREPSSIQQYCDRPQEYCLQFYQRQDSKKRTTIEVGSLTLRDTPYALGDWTSTVEELVLSNDHLSPQHKKNILVKIAETQPELLEKIPAVGEKVQIVFTASIDFGTKYRTIKQTPEMTQQLQMLLQKILANLPPSFLSVGRFDLKARSLEELLEWIVKVIECNAAGGIPTHVYDELLTILQKYEELYIHFDKMYEMIQKNKSPIAWRIGTALAWPWFIRISYSSVAKKWINFFDKSNEKAKQVKRVYRDIFTTLRTGRRERWRRRFESFWLISKRTMLVAPKK